MTRRFFQLTIAFSLFAATAMAHSAQAQTLIIGPGVQYRGYGQGYYGGYGQGYGQGYGGYGRGYYGGYGNGYRSYGRVYGPRVDSYTVYGNGPYGYGSGSQFQFPASGFYGNGNYNGYASPGFYQQPYVAPVYSPYGFSYGSSY